MIANKEGEGTFYCEKCRGFYNSRQLTNGCCLIHGIARKISDKSPEELWPERKTAIHIVTPYDNAVL